MSVAASVEAAGAGWSGQMAVRLGALTARVGDLAPGESLEERVFSTARACLDAAGLEQPDLDAVVISADDVADGRSITTMLHATAAGSYWRDEIRVTNGSLSALGLAAMRVAAGLSRRVLVVGWWLPTAEAAAIGLATLDVAHGRGLADPDRLEAGYARGASAACLVGDVDEGASLVLHGVAFGQADYDRWLVGAGEPAALLSRVGAQLAAQAGPLDSVGMFAAPAGHDWHPLVVAAGVPAGWRRSSGRGHGHATGLVQLAEAVAELEPGEVAIVAATGVPALLQAEAVAIEWSGKRA